MQEQSVSLVRYQPRFQSGVVALILPIQNEEFSIDITAAQQPDLSDIAGFYQTGKGDFWLAVAGDNVVGCIGLKDIGNQQAALRKMFVAQDWRGREKGIANALLSILLEHAAHRQLHDIYLGTTSKFLAAHRFYEKNGFREVGRDTLPGSFPVMKVDSKFYRLALR
ncbi:GNAT family N-acetyltransferase [Erwinia psidii]|uniref:N-acetyltransferase n=1 Tax=Erwinia psidii TaxID=69224 RepID=A0A3N6S0Z4_9GAMM|nr:GNAT family N-acetyltransferase [Erwinia psidii]MCX8957853.1 N-acetyltransferase [Erwinia psidii]MCX8960904.1 N-acetyltransferase [Erwinia psidii]MCX8964856.1 N-acetyltransferase [Erwinia psidii]RQM38467.1 N-acetyltransferase [Erwinia psidii]